VENEPKVKEWKVTGRFKGRNGLITFKKRNSEERYKVLSDFLYKDSLLIIHMVPVFSARKSQKFTRLYEGIKDMPEELQNEVLLWRMDR